MKQGCIREDAIEMRGRQVKSQEILLPYFASGIGARHGHKGGSALQPDRFVPQLCEGLEIAPRTATQIKNRERTLALDMPQQRRDVLADIVITRTDAEVLSTMLVMLERHRDDRLQIPGLSG